MRPPIRHVKSIINHLCDCHLNRRFFFLEQVRELVVDYTDVDCHPRNRGICEANYSTCADYIRSNVGKTCYCDIPFELAEEFPVFIASDISVCDFVTHVE